MGQLVHEDQGRGRRSSAASRSNSGRMARVGHLLPGQDLQALEQGAGLAAAVGLHHADEDVDPFGPRFRAASSMA